VANEAEPIPEPRDLAEAREMIATLQREQTSALAQAQQRIESLDQLGRGREERLEAVLDGAVGDRDREVGLPATGLAMKDQRAALADEVGAEIRADERGPQTRLQREVEVVDGLEVGEASPAREALKTGLLTVRDLLPYEQRQEVAVGPGLFLRLRYDLHVHAAHVGQVEPPKESVELLLGDVGRRAHWTTSVKLSERCRACST
jgi:hypothetical protein